MVKTTVIGCGVLGTKLAGALAYDGHQVRVYDNNEQLLNKFYLKLNEDQKILKEDGFVVNFVGSIYCFSKLEDAVRGSSFIFECISENLSVKKDLFEQIENYCLEDAVIATSSMRLSVDEIFEDLRTKTRCLGVRFLYPVYFIPEVELLTCKYTSLNALEKVRIFLEKMKKVAFFRSGDEPIVLNEEQRDARRNAYLRLLKEEKLITSHSITSLVPNLGLNEQDEKNQKNDDKKIITETSSSNIEKDCAVCMDNERNCVFHPCHHLCTCIKCGRLFFKEQDACPICRRPITNIFKVYLS